MMVFFVVHHVCDSNLNSPSPLYLPIKKEKEKVKSTALSSLVLLTLVKSCPLSLSFVGSLSCSNCDELDNCIVYSSEPVRGKT